MENVVEPALFTLDNSAQHWVDVALFTLEDLVPRSLLHIPLRSIGLNLHSLLWITVRNIGLMLPSLL